MHDHDHNPEATEPARGPAAAAAPDAGRRALSDALEISFRLLRWVFLLLLAAYLGSGIFIVREHERAFILSWGRVQGGPGAEALGPGLHWTWPKPLSEVILLPAGRVQTIEIDPLPPTKLEGGKPEPVNMAWDEFLLTGDANLIRAHWALRYTIADPWQYEFGYANTPRLLASEFRHAIVRTAAEFPIDRALRSDVESFRAAVQDALAARVAKLKLGVAVERVDLPGLRPPQPVAEAFDDVVRAENTRSEKISEAKAYANRRLAEAQGEASRRLSEAASYRQRLVSETQADAAYFERIYPGYVAQPGTVARTLLQDTLRRALAQTDQKYLLYRRDDGKQELRLWLGPERPKTPELLQPAPKDAKDR